MRIVNTNPGIIVAQNNMEIVRMDDTPPVIQMAGFISNTASSVYFGAYAVDPSVHDRLDHLELCIDGTPIGYRFEVPEHNTQELLFWELPDLGVAHGQYLIQFRPMDLFGNIGPVWPTLTSN